MKATGNRQFAPTVLDVALAGERFGRVLRTRVVGAFVLRASCYPGGLRTPAHRHPDAYWSCVVRGSLTERAHGGERTYGPGTMHFHPAGDPHHAVMGAGLVTALSITPAAALAARARLDARVPDGLAGAAIVQLGMRCVAEFHATDTASDLALEGHALELVATALRGRLLEERRPPVWLRSARDRIHDHVADGVPLTVLAEGAGVHPVHLVRAFRRHFGVTPGAYLRRLRVERARRALLETAGTIADIALDAGFTHQAHLTRVFRQHVGLSPGRYRRLHGAVPTTGRRLV